ncbi:MAG: FAD-dependent oxidoreductase [Alphaproteobacteria bacterium]|nr:FAD-dependent oxidoreductase [Alphaproteobacteria bacterium]MBU6471598.1 FAD-dependent oxidoreductase [Alphaproteobacteria bacterium]MDE2012078.1 FAD-dependent oxidoreductase [Alphaproteobacteria bacterium]MDE2073374.1 FAD-dependent oxidoreductase [Alphaproteobacteria bacterium]
MQTEKKYDVDVLVCGGGVAGAAAAIASARLGARTMLVEGRESLGGMCTNGYITGIAGLVEGLSEEWIDRLVAKGAANKRPHLPLVEPEVGKLELEQMVLQAGCRILYGVHVTDCVVEDERIAKVMAHSHGGPIEISAKVFVDCTGDADLAYAAGVPCEVGNAEFFGLNQGVTMGFRLSYVNVKKYWAAEEAFQKTQSLETRKQLVVAKEYEAIENGDLPYLIVPGLLVYPVPNTSLECGDVTLDATQTGYCRNDNAEDRTRQIVDQRRQVLELFHKFLSKYVPGFEDCVVTSVASMNGVRDSRRIVGEYVFTDADMAGGAKFDDCVVRNPEFFDAHHPTCAEFVAVRHVHVREPSGSAVCRPSRDDYNYKMHPYVVPGGYEARTNPRDWAELPYRSLVATKVVNLLAAGRNVSAEFHALGTIRVIAGSMSMGQAAGTAAAMCVKEKIDPRNLDGVRVRDALIEQGVPLDKAPGGHWEMLRNMPGRIDVASADFAVIVNDEGQSHLF